MEGLRASQPAQDHDLGCARVHAPLLTPRATSRSGPHPPVRFSGQPLPHSKAATLPHSARGLPTVHASRFSRPRRYHHRRLLVLSDLQARTVDHDRGHPPRTSYGSGHFMTLSRGLSSSSFYSPSRASGNPCPHIGPMRLQAFSAALSTTFIVARIPSHDSDCVVSGILTVAFIGKTAFNTQ